jgi:hypothetical protein
LEGEAIKTEAAETYRDQAEADELSFRFNLADDKVDNARKAATCGEVNEEDEETVVLHCLASRMDVDCWLPGF